MATDLGGPEALLAQIRQLLDAYLAMGDQTPVANEAAALAQAIDASGGGGLTEATPPPDPQSAMPMAPPGDTGTPPMDMPTMDLQEGEQGYSGSDLDQATKDATSFLKNRNKKSKAQQ